MGYTTEFQGKIRVEPPLTLKEYRFYKGLAGYDNRDKGEFHIPGAPDGYCQWEPDPLGESFAWDGNEKFYDSVEWMQIIVGRLASTGHTCNGVIQAQGEDSGDIWRLKVENNVVTKQEAKVSWED